MGQGRTDAINSIIFDHFQLPVVDNLYMKHGLGDESSVSFGEGSDQYKEMLQKVGGKLPTMHNAIGYDDTHLPQSAAQTGKM